MQVKNTKEVCVNVEVLEDGRLYIDIIDEKYDEHSCCTLTKKQAKRLVEYIQVNYTNGD